MISPGRGRRPRRPACPMGVPVGVPLAAPCARRAGDVAPYQTARLGATWPARAHGVHGASVVGADVPGGPRARWRLDGGPMRAARRGRRALPGGTSGRNAVGTGAWCSRGIRGRGRRPRRPASRRRSRWRLDGVPMRAARRGRRALPGGAYRFPFHPLRHETLLCAIWLTAQRQRPPFEVRESPDSRMERGEPHRETWASCHTKNRFESAPLSFLPRGRGTQNGVAEADNFL